MPNIVEIDTGFPQHESPMAILLANMVKVSSHAPDPTAAYELLLSSLVGTVVQVPELKGVLLPLLRSKEFADKVDAI